MHLHCVDDLVGRAIPNAIGAAHSAMTDRAVPAIATENCFLSPQTLQVLLLLLSSYIKYGLVEVLHLMSVECRSPSSRDIHKLE